MCPRCLQTMGRRSWKADGMEILFNGWRNGWSDARIAYAIHAYTKQPLFGRAEDGVAGSGSGAGEGVIPAFVAMGLFPEEMLRSVKHARRGDEMGED